MILLDGEISEDELSEGLESDGNSDSSQFSVNRYSSDYARQAFVAIDQLKVGDIIWDELGREGAVIEEISVGGVEGSRYYGLKSGKVTRNFREDEDSYGVRITRLRDIEALRDLELAEVERRYRKLLAQERRQDRPSPTQQAAQKKLSGRRKGRALDRLVEEIRVGDTVHVHNKGWRRVDRIDEVGGFLKLRLNGGEIVKRRPHSGAKLRALEWYDETDKLREAQAPRTEIERVIEDYAMSGARRGKVVARSFDAIQKGNLVEWPDLGWQTVASVVATPANSYREREVKILALESGERFTRAPADSEGALKVFVPDDGASIDDLFSKIDMEAL